MGDGVGWGGSEIKGGLENTELVLTERLVDNLAV